MYVQSYDDLRSVIAGGLWRLPEDIDVVVGIPRSGMLVASMIALALNRPLVDLEGFCRGRVLESGVTRLSASSSQEKFTHALVVDDSIRSGQALRKAVAEIESSAGSRLTRRYTTCVGYATKDTEALVNIALCTLPSPRIFEWNFMHHPSFLRDAAVDIDGVLCHDPSTRENDDSDRYIEFLNTARRLYIPSHPVGWLVTSRLERYRHETEDWLARHNVRYGELIMLDLPSAIERRRLANHGSFKGEVYRSLDARVFIESELDQAFQICRVSGKPVLSLEGRMRLLSPNSLSVRTWTQRVSNPRVGARWLRARVGDRRMDLIKNVVEKRRSGR